MQCYDKSTFVTLPQSSQKSNVRSLYEPCLSSISIVFFSQRIEFTAPQALHITSVLQNILNVVEFDMGMQESVNQPRFHHQWLPDVIRMEPNGFDEVSKNKLESLGYEILERNSLIIGRVDAILVLPNGKLEAGADKRGDDAGIGIAGAGVAILAAERFKKLRKPGSTRYTNGVDGTSAKYS